MRTTSSALILLAAMGQVLAAGAPSLISYQGQLTDASGNPVTATSTVRFTLLWGGTDNENPSTGRPLYQEDVSITSDTKGVFHHLIGSGTPTSGCDESGTGIPYDEPCVLSTSDFPDSATFVYLELRLDPLGANNLLVPRQRVVSVGYAMNADRLNSQPAGFYLDTSSSQQTKPADINFTDGGNPVIFNPNNPGASVSLNWYSDGSSDFPRIRYGGSGAGSGSGFLIQGTSDEIFFKIDEINQRVDIGDGGKVTVFDDGSAVFRGPSGNIEINRYSSLTVPAITLDHETGSNQWVIYSEDPSPHDLVILSRVAPADVRIAAQGGVANLEVDGDITCQNLTETSSIRWKENITTIPEAIEKIKQLRGVHFDWKATQRLDIGMIAEEVARVLPEIVAYEDDGVEARGLDYSGIVAVLVEAVKAQQLQLDKLSAEIERLERRLRSATRE